MKLFRTLPLLALAAIAAFAPSAHAEDIRIVTYNIENWKEHFDSRAVAAWAREKTPRGTPQDPMLANLVREERNQDDEDNWEASQVILNPAVNPDVMVFQEGCSLEDLQYFNKTWLKGAYKTCVVFESNSGRGQTIGLLLKDGFEIVETKNDYYKEKDTVPKNWLKADLQGDIPPAIAENRLFARGPAFVKIKTPSGYSFWMGTNHQKSKGGNNVDIAKWRLREAQRTHEIIKELAANGDDVVFGGDMNDELGFQEFEQEAGGDAIAAIVGTDGSVVLATRGLVDKNEISYGGYWRPNFRSFIDHMFVSKSAAGRVKSVSVYKDGLAPVASDHFPVVLVLQAK